MVNKPPVNAGDIRDMGFIPGWRRCLEKGMATHSSILTWRILWTEEAGGLHWRGLQRVRHDWNDLAHICAKHICYMYMIMSSADHDSFSFYFFLCNLYTFYFSCLSALARTSNTRIKVVRISILILFLILGENFSFLLLSIMLAVGLSYIAFIILRYGFL